MSRVSTASANHLLIAGNNLQVLPKLAPLNVDLVITSPPYAIDGNGVLGGGQSYRVHRDDTSPDTYVAQAVQLFQVLDRHVKPRGTVCYNIGYGMHFPSLPFHVTTAIESETNWCLGEVLVWKKSTAFPVSSSPCHLTRIWEYIFVFVRKEHLQDFQTNKVLSSQSRTGQPYYTSFYNFIEAPNADAEIRNAAPTKATYSCELVAKIMEIYAPTGCKVLDPFVGSGTTSLTCHQMGCTSVGIDVDVQCINFAAQLLKAHGASVQVKSAGSSTSRSKVKTV